MRCLNLTPIKERRVQFEEDKDMHIIPAYHWVLLLTSVAVLLTTLGQVIR